MEPDAVDLADGPTAGFDRGDHLSPEFILLVEVRFAVDVRWVVAANEEVVFVIGALALFRDGH